METVTIGVEIYEGMLCNLKTKKKLNNYNLLLLLNDLLLWLLWLLGDLLLWCGGLRANKQNKINVSVQVLVSKQNKRAMHSPSLVPSSWRPSS